MPAIRLLLTSSLMMFLITAMQAQKNVVIHLKEGETFNADIIRLNKRVVVFRDKDEFHIGPRRCRTLYLCDIRYADGRIDTFPAKYPPAMSRRLIGGSVPLILLGNMVWGGVVMAGFGINTVVNSGSDHDTKKGIALIGGGTGGMIFGLAMLVVGVGMLEDGLYMRRLHNKAVSMQFDLRPGSNWWFARYNQPGGQPVAGLSMRF